MAFKLPSLHFSLPKPRKTNQISPSISLFAPPIFSFLYLPNNDAAAGRKFKRRQLCAISMEETQYSIKETEVVSSPSSSSNKNVLVIGGTEGVGQLIVASLLSRSIKLHLLLRDPSKAEYLFGTQDEDKLRIWKGDTRNPEDIDPAMFEGVTHVICCTGTTAFPSKRWGGDNTPEKVDWEGIRNLVSALPRTLKRFVLVSSVGVTKFDELPWSIMNLFGVLKYKKMGEDYVRNSGLPYTQAWKINRWALHILRSKHFAASNCW